MAAILVVDDEASMREFLEILLGKQGHRVHAAADVKGALARVAEGGADLVVTDLRLGAESGIDVLRRVKELSPATEVVMVTAFATTENAIQAMKLGAYDYVLKPFKVEELRLVVDKALEHRALVQENRVLRHRVGKPRLATPEIVGRSAVMEEVRGLVEKVAPTRTTVLVTGESGVGKEVVARAIHDQSDRRDQPFVAINCGAIPEGLIESELFGHERGSFTGAVEAKAGLFEVAGSGTHFLDRFAVEAGRGDMRLSPEAERRLHEYDYPGNVRELANVVERAVTLADGPLIQVADLPPGLRVPAGAAPPSPAPATDLPDSGMDLQSHLDDIERRLLEQALGRAGGVKTEAARLLSLTFRSLRYRLAKFGIDR